MPLQCKSREFLSVDTTDAMFLNCKSKEFLSVDTTDFMFLNVVPVWGEGTPRDGLLPIRERLHPKGIPFSG